jgi:hypothetical protein
VIATPAPSQLLQLGVSGLEGVVAGVAVVRVVGGEAPVGGQVWGHEEDRRTDAQSLQQRLHLSPAVLTAARPARLLPAMSQRHLDTCN